jgi:hypothetical protein
VLTDSAIQKNVKAIKVITTPSNAEKPSIANQSVKATIRAAVAAIAGKNVAARHQTVRGPARV